MKNNVITLHNIYRRLVRKELEEVESCGVSQAEYETMLEMEGLICSSCHEKWIPFKSRVAVDSDHWSPSAYSTYCTQCVADHLGWQAEKQFMNARIHKDDRWLLTPKGSAALAADPE